MNLDKIYKIKKEIKLLIDEIDPQSKIPIKEDTILKSKYNKKLLKDALSLIENYTFAETTKKKKRKERKQTFFIPSEKRMEIPISEKPIPISTFTYFINDFVDSENMKKVKASEITSWLLSCGYLEEDIHEDGKTFKIITEKAREIGMLKENKTNSYGRNYDVNLYSPETQKFIIDNLGEIASFILRKNEFKM